MHVVCLETGLLNRTFDMIFHSYGILLGKWEREKSDWVNNARRWLLQGGIAQSPLLQPALLNIFHQQPEKWDELQLKQW